jgi:hypothetical protein
MLGDNIGGAAVIHRQITLHYDEVWISTGLPRISHDSSYVHVFSADMHLMFRNVTTASNRRVSVNYTSEPNAKAHLRLY